MSGPRPELPEVLEALEDRGLEEAEVYVKRGRSRRLESTPHTRTSGFQHERGWAVRASSDRASFFARGTGEPSPDHPWPEPDGHPLRLPDPAPVPGWSEPGDFETPLVGEREGFGILDAVGRELGSEISGGRLVHALLEDGSSESELRSLRGVHARWRSRVATLRLTAAAPGPRGEAVTVTLARAEREARAFSPPSLARRLADLLAVRAAPPPEAERDRGELLLAPAVVRRLLGALLPLLVGPQATSRVSRFRDRRGRIGSERLTVIDDGRLEAGLLQAPVDGEGLPTREVVLVEEGSFRQPLVAWWQSRSGTPAPSGCSRRASWRDLPRPGPTHLYLAAGRTPVADLISDLARGYYLLDVPGPTRLDFDQDRLHLPVAGFAVHGGRAVAPVAGAALRGSVSAFLRNVQAVGRDLSFGPERGGLLGAPSLLVSGLELVRLA